MRLQDGNQYPGKRVIISLRSTNFSKTCIDLLCYNPSKNAALLTVRVTSKTHLQNTEVCRDVG